MLYNVFLPVLQFSAVSIIPPLLHTHSSIYHPRFITFFSQYFSFPLSVSFHHCCIPIHPSIRCSYQKDKRVNSRKIRISQNSDIEKHSEVLASCFLSYLNPQSAAALPTNATEPSNVLWFNNLWWCERSTSLAYWWISCKVHISVRAKWVTFSIRKREIEGKGQWGERKWIYFVESRPFTEANSRLRGLEISFKEIYFAKEIPVKIHTKNRSDRIFRNVCKILQDHLPSIPQHSYLHYYN